MTIDMSALLTRMLILFTLIIIGYVLAKIGKLTKDFTKGASYLSLNIFMAASVLNSVISVDIQLSPSELGNVLVCCCVMELTCYLFGWLCAKLFRIAKDKAPMFELSLAVSNNLFIALPVAQSIYGDSAVFCIALTMLPFNLLVYTYGSWRTKSVGGVGYSLRIWDIFSIPFIATLISIILFFFKIPVPSAFKQLVSTASSVTVPLSMLVIGTSLAGVSFFEAFKRKELYLVTLLALIIEPIVVFFIVRFFAFNDIILASMVCVGAAPTAMTVSILSIEANLDSEYAAEICLQTTALSIITIPLMVMLLL